MRMVDAEPRGVGSTARRRIHQLDDRHLLGRRRQSDPPRHRYPHHSRQNGRAGHYDREPHGKPNPNPGVVGADRMEGRWLVFAGSRQRRGGWQLDLEFRWNILAATHGGTLPGFYAPAISAGQSGAVISHAASVVRPGIFPGRSCLWLHSRQQYGFGAVLFKLRIDERTDDRDRGVPFAFYSADKDRHLWIAGWPDI